MRVAGHTVQDKALVELSAIVKTLGQQTVMLLGLLDDQLKMISVLQGQIETLEKRVSALERR